MSMTTAATKTKKSAPIDYEAEIAELHVLLRALAEEAIMMRNGGKLAEKENEYSGDIVTEADKLIEAEIVKRIASRHPDHYVYGEEGNKSGSASSPYHWVITPIDGTRNFSKGLKFFSIAVAFLENGVPVMGVLYFPELARFVHAIKGRGVFDNGQSLATFERPMTDRMSNALIAGATTRKKSGRAEVLGALRTASLNLLNFGSTTYNCLMLAEGKIDAAVNADAVLFNVVAAIPILQEAGCVISGFEGDDIDLTQERVPFIAACNPELVSDIKKNVLEVWRSAEK